MIWPASNHWGIQSEHAPQEVDGWKENNASFKLSISLDEPIRWINHANKQLQYSSCAIVGSGPGTMDQQAYGAEIDSHEVVVRVSRMPPLDGSLKERLGQQTDIYYRNLCHECDDGVFEEFVGQQGFTGKCCKILDHKCHF